MIKIKIMKIMKTKKDYGQYKINLFNKIVSLKRDEENNDIVNK